MWIFGLAFAITSLLLCCKADESELIKFLTSGISRSDDNVEGQENPKEITENELINFMKRSGLLALPEEKLNNVNSIQSLLASLPATNQQPNQVMYLPQNGQSAFYGPVYQQQQQLPLASNPVRASDQSAFYAPIQQQPIPLASNPVRASDQTAYYAPVQQQQVPLAPNPVKAAASSTMLNIGNSAINQGSASKSTSEKGIAKADRQGLYGYDGHGYEDGYSNHGGHGTVEGHNGYIGHQERNAGGYHVPEHGYSKHLPIPSLAIKIDPLGILKLLLQLIPRPLLNLNGKVFLGLELGKGVGLGKGKPIYGAGHGHYGGGEGKVITIG